MKSLLLIALIPFIYAQSNTTTPTSTTPTTVQDTPALPQGPGQGIAGSPCTSNSDCKTGFALFCSDGLCRRQNGPGGQCLSDGECLPGLVCGGDNPAIRTCAEPIITSVPVTTSSVLPVTSSVPPATTSVPTVTTSVPPVTDTFVPPTTTTAPVPPTMPATTSIAPVTSTAPATSQPPVPPTTTTTSTQFTTILQTMTIPAPTVTLNQWPADVPLPTNTVVLVNGIQLNTIPPQVTVQPTVLARKTPNSSASSLNMNIALSLLVVGLAYLFW